MAKLEPHFEPHFEGASSMGPPLHGNMSVGLPAGLQCPAFTPVRPTVLLFTPGREFRLGQCRVAAGREKWRPTSKRGVRALPRDCRGVGQRCCRYYDSSRMACSERGP
jgi:hypothetical protein